MNDDRRKRLDEIRCLVITADDVIAIPLPRDDRGNVVMNGHGYEQKIGVRVMLDQVLQKLNAVYFEEKLAYEATPVGFRFDHAVENLPAAIELAMKAIATHERFSWPNRVRPVLAELLTKISQASV